MRPANSLYLLRYIDVTMLAHPNFQWNSDDDLMVLGHTDMFNKYCLWAAPSISFLSGIGVFYGGTRLELLILLHRVCSHQQNIYSFIALCCYCIELFVIPIIDNLCLIYCKTYHHVLSVTCQSVLGAEGLSLAFRHIVSSLLWYCTQHSSEELLHEVIICVGYFTVNHPDNQVNLHRVFSVKQNQSTLNVETYFLL